MFYYVLYCTLTLIWSVTCCFWIAMYIRQRHRDSSTDRNVNVLWIVVCWMSLLMCSDKASEARKEMNAAAGEAQRN